jgi:hypothetical protein
MIEFFGKNLTRRELASSIGSALLGWTQTSTGASLRTVDDKLHDNTVSVKDFGAVGGGVTIDTVGSQAALNYASSGSVRFPNDIYKIAGVTLKNKCRVYGDASILMPSGNSQTLITLEAGSSFQDGYWQELRDIRIDGTGYTGITGVGVSTTSYVAGLVMSNVRAYNTSNVSFNLGYAQFSRITNVVAANGTGIGFFVGPTPNGGGANSNGFYGIIAASKEVGFIIDGTAPAPNGGTWKAIDNNFYNAQINGNTICGIAFFDAQANMYGGSPENNAGGIINHYAYNGKIIPKCSMYINNSNINIHGFVIEENSIAKSCFKLENNSTLNATDISGYSKAGTITVDCDETSMINLFGFFSMIGFLRNVSTWPEHYQLYSAKYAPAASLSTCHLQMYGSPIEKLDSSISLLLSEQAPIINPYGGNHASLSYIEDEYQGYCSQLVCPPVEKTSVNEIQISGLLSNNSILVSFLIMASVDCTVTAFFNDGLYHRMGGFDGGIKLNTGKAVRVVFARANYSAGIGSISIIPWDTNAPTLKISKFVVYQGETSLGKTEDDIAKIVRTGLFNPGITRETSKNLALKSAKVNFSNKYPGKQVWDTTYNRLVFSSGRENVDVWKDGVNSTAYTPV